MAHSLAALANQTNKAPGSPGLSSTQGEIGGMQMVIHESAATDAGEPTSERSTRGSVAQKRRVCVSQNEVPLKKTEGDFLGQFGGEGDLLAVFFLGGLYL